MSTPSANELLPNENAEALPEPAQVAAFLRAHPDFFAQHPDLLAELRLPHAQRGAVSLVERQVALLRELLAREQRRLRELIENGKRNDRIQQLMHALTLDLLRADTLAGALAALEDSLLGPFRASALALRLHRPPAETLPGYVQAFDAAGVAHLAEVERVLRRHRAWCGEVAGAVRDWLFGDAGVRSAAILPVGSEAEYGLLAIGSEDPLAYNKAMDTHYLDRLAALLGASFARWLGASGAGDA